MDLINRTELLRHLEEEIRIAPNSIALNAVVEIKGYVNRMPRVDGIEWHKVTKRPLTQEEKDYYEEFGVEEAEIYECEMPTDGQEILVATSWGIDKDIFYSEGFEIWLDNLEDLDGVLAWAEMPKYEEEKEKTNE